MKTILLIDDDRDFRALTKRHLADNGFNCLDCGTADQAFEILSTKEVDIVLSDLNLKKEGGKEIVTRVVQDYPLIPVIIVTGYSNVRSTVELMRLGATDYLAKPLNMEHVVPVINAAINRAQPTRSGSDERIHSSTSAAYIPSSYIFSPGKFLQSTLHQIDMVAPTNYSVIIYGESGSGKEAFAQEIHKRSSRKSKKFLAIDCGALSKELSASILFGHEKGAFTGAIGEKEGAFEAADGGTVFLDEVANLPYEVQVSLLRMTQERKIRRVGGNKEIPVDVRIIVASNIKLWDACQQGLFREDLYHRLNEFAINVLPLRERKEDIIFYSNHFISETNAELGKDVTGFSPEAMAVISDYPWPGNLRELRNVVRRSVLTTRSQEIGLDDVAWHFAKLAEPASARQPDPVTGPLTPEPNEENIALLKAFEETGFNKGKMRAMFGWDSKTLKKRINHL